MVAILLGFCRTLRAAGVPVNQHRSQSMLLAVDLLDVLDPMQVYWAARLTLCADPDDLRSFDSAFALYFGAEPPPTGRPREQPQQLQRAAPFELSTEGGGESEDGDQDRFAAQASEREVLRHKDVAALSPGEREELRRLFALLRPQVAPRRSRRMRPAPRGTIDPGRTVRRMIEVGGEPARLEHRSRSSRRRRLVLLIDVSGSMSPYADILLRFAHAATRAAPQHTEVFTLGTRLTRISRELRLRDPDAALVAAGRAVPDWSGGTRLGDTLKAFSDRWGQRGLARGAVVVLCSDGWERGDAGELGEQMRRLSRLSHAVIWVNPHKGKEGFAPVTGGMVAALPHLDDLVAGHSFAALEELVQVIAHA